MTLSTVDRYDPAAASRVGDRAVVLGGSVAGLCAARVLADCFEEVIVLERDRLPDEPVTHDGAPQTGHPHVMLEAGRATLEDLYPGFCETVLSAGGLLVDASTDVHYYDGGDLLASGPNRIPMYCASRTLFEWVLRRRTDALEGVTLRNGCQFLTYLADVDGTRVTGIVFRDESGARAELEADLVVDATGRTSKTPTWLDERGYDAPPVEEVHVDVTYSTIRVDRPPEARDVYLVPPSHPRTRGGAAIPVEGDRWEVILQGYHGDDAPTDTEGVLEFAESLPVSAFGELVGGRAWKGGGIDHYPFRSSVRRRYERLERFPEGLVVTGDAVASFNPVYGQGMSIAALDALVLHHALAEGSGKTLAPRFFARVGDVVDAVWRVAVGADFEFPQTTGPKPRGTDLFNRYVSRLVRQAHTDGVLTDAFYRVFRLESPPSSLLAPSIAWRVLRP